MELNPISFSSVVRFTSCSDKKLESPYLKRMELGELPVAELADIDGTSKSKYVGSGAYHCQLLTMCIPKKMEIVDNLGDVMKRVKNYVPNKQSFFNTPLSGAGNSMTYWVAYRMSKLDGDTTSLASAEAINQDNEVMHYHHNTIAKKGRHGGVCAKAMYAGDSSYPVVMYMDHVVPAVQAGDATTGKAGGARDVSGYYIPVVLSNGTVAYAYLGKTLDFFNWEEVIKDWAITTKEDLPMLAADDPHLMYIDDLDIFTITNLKPLHLFS